MSWHCTSSRIKFSSHRSGPPTVDPEGNAGWRKAGTVLCFGTSGLGRPGRAAWAHPPPQEVQISLGDSLLVSDHPATGWGHQSLFATILTYIAPQLKDTRGSWLKDTGISSVERHLAAPPWWSRVKNPPPNALDTGLIPGLGGYNVSRSNKPVQHKSWARALKLVFRNKSSYSNKPAQQLESSSCWLQLEKVHVQQNRISTAGNRKDIECCALTITRSVRTPVSKQVPAKFTYFMYRIHRPWYSQKEILKIIKERKNFL